MANTKNGKAPTLAELDKMRRMLVRWGNDNRDGIVCSEPWADAALASIRGRPGIKKKEFAALWRSLYRSAVYPPGGNVSRMRVCPECGRHCPPSCRDVVDLPGRERGLCADCLANSNLEPAERGEPAGRPTEPPNFHGALLRLSVWIRCLDKDGQSVLVAQHLSGEALRERFLIKRESDRQLKREIAAHDRGTWMPSTVP